MWRALSTVSFSSNSKGFWLNWDLVRSQAIPQTFWRRDLDQTNSTRMTLLSIRFRRQVARRTKAFFFHDFQKATFLCFLAPFLNESNENSAVALDLKKIWWRLRISQRKGQISIPKRSYLSLEMLQYLSPREVGASGTADHVMLLRLFLLPSLLPFFHSRIWTQFCRIFEGPCLLYQRRETCNANIKIVISNTM